MTNQIKVVANLLKLEKLKIKNRKFMFSSSLDILILVSRKAIYILC
jgi:hypothetical protein